MIKTKLEIIKNNMEAILNVLSKSDIGCGVVCAGMGIRGHFYVMVPGSSLMGSEGLFLSPDELTQKEILHRRFK